MTNEGHIPNDLEGEITWCGIQSSAGNSEAWHNAQCVRCYRMYITHLHFLMEKMQDALQTGTKEMEDAIKSMVRAE